MLVYTISFICAISKFLLDVFGFLIKKASIIRHVYMSLPPPVQEVAVESPRRIKKMQIICPLKRIFCLSSLTKSWKPEGSSGSYRTVFSGYPQESSGTGSAVGFINLCRKLLTERPGEFGVPEDCAERWREKEMQLARAVFRNGKPQA